MKKIFYTFSTFCILIFIHFIIFNIEYLALAVVISLAISVYAGKLIHTYRDGVNINFINWTSEWICNPLNDDESIYMSLRSFEMNLFIGKSDINIYGLINSTANLSSVSKITIEDLRTTFHTKLSQKRIQETLNLKGTTTDLLNFKVRSQDLGIIFCSRKDPITLIMRIQKKGKTETAISKSSSKIPHELMSLEEIHQFGIELVFRELKKAEFKILEVNKGIGQLNSIIGINNDLKIVVAVKTDVYPNKGQITTEQKDELSKFSKTHNAKPYFASVGIANANATTDQERSLPIKGNGFHIAFEGIKEL